MDERGDDESSLLAARTDAAAFAAFYRRHASSLTGFLLARTRDAETAADLAAETFAVWLDPPGRPSRFAGYTPVPRGGRVTFRTALPGWAGRHPRLFVFDGDSSAPGRLLLRGTVP